MILHRNGHGHGSGKSYHKSFFVFFFFFGRCLHWVDIQYLDTYFGFICFRMAWNNGVSERFQPGELTLLFITCPAFLYTTIRVRLFLLGLSCLS